MAYASIMTYLDDPVLGRPAALPLEHGVDVVGLRHAHGLRLRADGVGRHVPLSSVLVELEVVEPLEGRLRAQDHLVAVVLQENVCQLKGERENDRLKVVISMDWPNSKFVDFLVVVQLIHRPTRTRISCTTIGKWLNLRNWPSSGYFRWRESKCKKYR